jgi:hypothetical protein
MANSKTREKRRMRRMKQSQMTNAMYKAKPDPDEESEDEVEEEGEELDESAKLQAELESAAQKEITQKDMVAMDTAYMQPMGQNMDMSMPTSWDELDAQDLAEDQADEVRELTWDVQDLVHNIVCSPDLAPDEKATAIGAVGDGFGQRVQAILAAPPDGMTKELDMDLLEVESIIAKDRRSEPTGEKIGDWITKATLSGTARKKLTPEQFALPAKRKYPIHDKAHVRNALARAAQEIKAGGPGAADAKAALPKIKAAAKKFGIGDYASKALIIEKDASGSWRAVMWPSNNFKDWDGETVSEKAHLEYVDWVNKNMDCAPVFVSWHTPETRREHQVDYVAYENGFLLMSAPLTEKEAAGLFIIQKETDLGMSHGTFVLERNPGDKNIIEKYRMVEVSDLAFDRAANPFTDFEILTKEAQMDKLQYLTKLLGSEEKAKAYIDKAGLKQKELREAGVKEAEARTETKVEAKVETPAAPDQAAIVEAVLKALDIDGLELTMKGLVEASEKVPVLEELIKELKGTKEEELAQMINPPASRQLLWSKARASTDDKTIVDEEGKDKTLVKSKKDLGWLSKLTNTTPIESTIGGA